MSSPLLTRLLIHPNGYFNGKPLTTLSDPPKKQIYLYLGCMTLGGTFENRTKQSFEFHL